MSEHDSSETTPHKSIAFDPLDSDPELDWNPEIDWDPEIDTPARILVIGGGPAGVEAALYARFLGYDVTIAERRRVGQQLAAWGDQPMPGTWSAIASPLGIAALQAQGTLQIEDFDETPSCRRYVEQYLIPVAKTDLLYNSVQIQAEIKSISRQGLFSGVPVSNERKSELEFRVLIESRARGQYTEIFDAIVDCSGHGGRLGLASGGGRAAGETELLSWRSDRSSQAGQQQSPAAAGKDADKFPYPQLTVGLLDPKALCAAPGKKIISFGGSWEACCNALSLAELTPPDHTRIIWLIPRTKGIKAEQSELPWEAAFELGVPGSTNSQDAPISAWERSVADRAKRVRSLRESSPGGFSTLDVWGVESVSMLERGGFELVVQSQLDETMSLACDQLILSPSRCADWSFSRPLNLTTSGEVLTSEPNYYVLGDKSRRSFASASPDLMSRLLQTREQIRQAFSLVGGRRELNLYRTVKPQLD